MRKVMTGPVRVEKFWSRVARRDSGCWEWTGSTNGPGYGKIWDGEKVEMAHRFAYRVSVGVIPAGMFLCHKCDNPPCVRPDHLFVGTQRDNLKDAYIKGRLRINVLNAVGIGTAKKLTPDMVRRIRERLASGESQQKVADDVGVTQGNISFIARGKIWGHVK